MAEVVGVEILARLRGGRTATARAAQLTLHRSKHGRTLGGVI